MPNDITTAGLQTKTLSEIVAELTAAFQTIYGNDINLDQNSPDGQLLNILAQASVDNLELAELIDASFSIAGAFGRSLDERVAINGLSRRVGTFTMQPITVTLSQNMTLQGLDEDINDVNGTGFTVADDAGTQFVLAETFAYSGGGPTSLMFRAKDQGRVETVPNTITTLITILAGVDSVNNPLAAASIGVDEETDTALRLRHARAFKLPSIGPAEAIEAALWETPGVTDAFVAENDTGSTLNGVVANGIWCIVENGTDIDVATTIYRKKQIGIPMTGAVTVEVLRAIGQHYDVKFSRPILQNLYVKMTLTALGEDVSFDEDDIKAKLAAALVYKLNQRAHVKDILTAMDVIAPDALLSDVAVSIDGSAWTTILSPGTYQKKFVTTTGLITIS